jgi:hypothetical protein
VTDRAAVADVRATAVGRERTGLGRGRGAAAADGATCTLGRSTLDGAAARGVLSAELIPRATTAHPATAAQAASEDSTRTTGMVPVCQVLLV